MSYPDGTTRRASDGAESLLADIARSLGNASAEASQGQESLLAWIANRLAALGDPEIALSDAQLVQTAGKTIYVSKSAQATDTRTGLSAYDSSRPFATIQAAIDAAVSGETVEVQAGDYSAESGTPKAGVTVHAKPGATVDSSFEPVSLALKENLLKTVTAKVAGYAIANADSGSIHEVTISGSESIELDNSVTVGTRVDIRLLGAGILTFTPTGTATITGSTRLYGSGGTATVYKASATRWEVVTESGNYDPETLDYAQVAAITNDYRIKTIDNFVRHIGGESEANGWNGVTWDAQSTDHYANLRGAWFFRRMLNASGDQIDIKSGHALAKTGSPTQGTDGITLNGSTQYLELPNNSDFQLTTAATVACWVKVSSGAAGAQAMAVSKQLATGNQRGWWLGHDSSGVLAAAVYETGAGTGFKLYKDNAATNLRDGQWHHIAFTFAPDDLKLYLDGVAVTLSKSTDDTVNDIHPSTAELNIGASGDGASGFLNATVRNVNILAATLSAADILALKELTGQL